MDGITTAEGWSIAKVEIETVGGASSSSSTEGSRIEIPAPYNFTPAETGTIRIIITITDGTNTAEFCSDELTVKPLEYQAFSIEKANFDKRLGLKVELIPGGEAYLDRKGVFETQALLVEMIDHGTNTMSAQEVKNLLSKNEIIYYGETLDDDTGFENLYEYIDGTEGVGGDGSHLSSIMNRLMISTKNVLMKLNKKIKIYSVRGDFEHEDLLKYVKSYRGYYYLVSACDITESDLNYWDSGRNKVERDALKQLVKISNVWKNMVSLGNNKIAHSGNVEYVVQKDDEKDTDYGYYTARSSGTDGVMGSDDSGVTHSYTFVPAGVEYGGQYSSHPTKQHIGDDDLRNGSSCLFNPYGEASSEAVMTCIGKYRLSSLANQLANPNITKEENNKIIRSEADKADVYVDDEYYGSTKSVNPGRTLEQFFPGTISTFSLGSGLVELPSGLYRNCIAVGPGCVDESGTAVTADNYRDMIGRKLYISSSVLRKMGRRAGDTLEYTYYLCTDSKGTGAGENASEAFKSICSRTFTVQLEE